MRPASSPHARAPGHTLVLALLAAVASAALLVGCGSSQPTASSAQPDAPAADTADTSVAAADRLAADSLTADSARSDTMPPDAASPDTVPQGRGDALAADSALDARPDSAQSLFPRSRPPTPDPEDAPPKRVFVDADSLSAFERDGEPLQDLIGNVFVRQDSTQLRSLRALRYLRRDSTLFTGRVRLFERGDSLYADTLRYNRRTEIGQATGNVRLTDGQVVVFAPSARYDANAKRTLFPDSIILVDSARVLRASSGLYFSDEERAEFYGTVRMTERATGTPDTTTQERATLRTYLEADSLVYFRETEVLNARGDVFIERRGGANDPAVRASDRTYLLGNRIRNNEKRRRSEAIGRALLIQIQTDSTGAPTDTLFTAAERLNATRSDTLRRVIAQRNVRIWNAGLAAVADSAVYDRIPPVAPDSSAPPPAPDGIRSDGIRSDSLRSLRADSSRADSSGPLRTRAALQDTLQQGPSGSASAGDASAEDASAGDAPASNRPSREETRLFGSPVVWFDNSQLTGQPIRVIARNRSIDSVYVDADAFAVQEDSATKRLQQLKGRSMIASFQRDSLRRLVAQPNAQTIWFRSAADGALDGAIKASGDRITLLFRGGSIDKAGVYNGVQSNYFQKGDIPDPFALDGLQWMPERAPTKAAFVQQERVRRRFPSLAAPPPTLPSVPTDSLRTARPPASSPQSKPPKPPRPQ